MRKQQGLESDDLFSKLSDGGGECIVLRTEDLHLLLQVCKPLLLALSALESGDSV